jgi:hypothetical protein
MRLRLICGALAVLHAAPALAQAAPTQPAAAAAKVEPGADEIICRKTLETGSLVRRTKQCFTRAEWDRIAATNRAGNQKVADQLSGGHNCEATGTC